MRSIKNHLLLRSTSGCLLPTGRRKGRKNKMKHYRQFLFLLAMLPVGTFAKDNFKMTGKIDGVGNDTLCIEYVILQPKTGCQLQSSCNEWRVLFFYET